MHTHRHGTGARTQPLAARASAVLALVALLAGVLLVGAGSARQSQDGLDAIPLPGLNARLEQLNPSDPMGYFLLAEEVALERHVRPARQLAERLYVLAFEIDRATPRADGSGRPLAASACLGLSALTPRAERRAWLRAIAHLVEPAGQAQTGLREGVAVVPALGPDQAAIDLSTALGQLRAGEGKRARATFARPGVWTLLEGYENLLSDGAPDRASQRIERWLDEWPSCPTCGNRRVVQRNGAGRLCPTCGGNPGPQLSGNELLAQIRAESFLLRGVYGSWGAQTLADLGQPLIDPDPARLAEVMQVDASLRVFRNGQWQKP